MVIDFTRIFMLIKHLFPTLQFLIVWFGSVVATFMLPPTYEHLQIGHIVLIKISLVYIMMVRRKVMKTKVKRK